MNKELTIVFSSYQSQHLLIKLLKQLHKKYKILIIENSLDRKIKKNLEKKFSGIEVIIPNKNLGLAKSFNLGIKKSKTKFVFLNNPDIKIKNQAIKDLITVSKKIKNFGIISPTYKIQKIYKIL
jgi:GT2 family glycosyltransferase